MAIISDSGFSGGDNLNAMSSRVRNDIISLAFLPSRTTIHHTAAVEHTGGRGDEDVRSWWCDGER